jgi:hypothetical protein
MAESAASAFEQIKHTDEQGEYWLARELGDAPRLRQGYYTQWMNQAPSVAARAKASCHSANSRMIGANRMGGVHAASHAPDSIFVATAVTSESISPTCFDGMA